MYLPVVIWPAFVHSIGLFVLATNVTCKHVTDAEETACKQQRVGRESVCKHCVGKHVCKDLPACATRRRSTRPGVGTPRCWSCRCALPKSQSPQALQCLGLGCRGKAAAQQRHARSGAHTVESSEPKKQNKEETKGGPQGNHMSREGEARANDGGDGRKQQKGGARVMCSQPGPAGRRHATQRAARSALTLRVLLNAAVVVRPLMPQCLLKLAQLVSLGLLAPQPRLP